MVNISNKVFIAIITIFVIIAIIAVLIAMNFMGWGTALSGIGGPFAAGFYKLLVSPLSWASVGGWPTLLVFYIISFAIIPLLVAYSVWHFDIPYKITGSTAPSPASNYDNSMKREPEEPERSNITPAKQ